MYTDMLNINRFLSTTFGNSTELAEYVAEYAEVDLLFFCFWDPSKDDSCFLIRVRKRDHRIIEAVEMIGDVGVQPKMQQVTCSGGIAREGEISFEKVYPASLCNQYSWLPSAPIEYRGVWCPILRGIRGAWSFILPGKRKQKGAFVMRQL